MFDLSRLTVRQLDHLQPWRVYSLQREVRSPDGRVHPAGMEFRFEFALVRMEGPEVEIHGLDPQGDAVVFAARRGELREWFSDTGREWRPSVPSVPAGAPPSAEASEVPMDWLAAQPEFAEAAAVLAGRSGRSGRDAPRDDADTLRMAASALAAREPACARLLAERGLRLYHAWLSQAASGGEGAAMLEEVQPHLAALRLILG